MKKLTIAGAGLADIKSMSRDCYDAIREADFIMGAGHIIEALKNTAAAELFLNKNVKEIWRPEEICTELISQKAKATVVLMSGDTGFNSGCTHLINEMKRVGIYDDYDVIVLPAVGAIASLAARAKVSWDEAALLSLHGKRQNIYHALVSYKRVFILSGRKTSQVMEWLKDSDFKESSVYIGERMGLADEKLIFFENAFDYEKREFDWASTMLILPRSNKPLRSFGLCDLSFLRADVPMTKSEVRSIAISNMAIRKNDVVYDIGSGTGSISIEASFAACYGRVYAFEMNEKAAGLTQANIDKFFCQNITLINKEASAAMDELEPCDVAFIGGSKGYLKEIIDKLYEKNKSVRIVMNTVSVEGLSEAVRLFDEARFEEVSISQISVARAKKYDATHIMTAQNPVNIISTRGRGI